MHFREWKLLYFDCNLTEVNSLGSNKQQASISSDNGLALNRQQAIILTHDDIVYWRIYASLSLDELKPCIPVMNISIQKCSTDSKWKWLPNYENYFEWIMT